MNAIAAVVVTFFPDGEQLRLQLQSLSAQVRQVLVVDNTPIPPNSEDSALPELAAVRYHRLGANRGVAYAQNFGIAWARQLQCSHVILFDQDSQPVPGLVEGLMGLHDGLIAQGQKIAALGPVFVDVKSGKRSPAMTLTNWCLQQQPVDPNADAPVATEYLIASGALISLATLDAVGGMREELFIDWVDIEWCLRAKRLGYQSFLAPQLCMAHSVGDATKAVLGRSVDLHTELRNYYMVRNAVYLLRDSNLPRAWRLSVLLRLPAFVLVYSFYSLSKSRWRAFKLLLRACVDGYHRRMGCASGVI